MIFKWPSWLRWLSPFLGHLLAIFIILLFLPILMRLKIEGIHTIGLYYSQCLFFKKKNQKGGDIGSKKVLVPNPQEKQESKLYRVVSSKKEMNTCFTPRRLGVDAINDLMSFATYRARPHPNTQNVHPRLPFLEIFFQPCFSVNRTHSYSRLDVTCILWASELYANYMIWMTNTPQPSLGP